MLIVIAALQQNVNRTLYGLAFLWLESQKSCFIAPLALLIPAVVLAQSRYRLQELILE
jgi:hypothetical protein